MSREVKSRSVSKLDLDQPIDSKDIEPGFDVEESEKVVTKKAVPSLNLKSGLKVNNFIREKAVTKPKKELRP